MQVSTEWLERTNEEFRKQDIPLDNRPFLALLKYSSEVGEAFLGFGTTSQEKIFNWYKSKYGSEFMNRTGYFQSVYYLDSEFWQISIPVIFGTMHSNPFECLPNMPQEIQNEVFVDSRKSSEYVLFWANCFDYAYGHDDLMKSKYINSEGMSFFRAADQDLRMAVTHLSNRVDNAGVVWNCRNALEKFMKAMIGFKIGLSEKKAKELNHNLDKIYDELVNVIEINNLASKSELGIYPDYKNDRYDEVRLDKLSQWKCFKFAQVMGALVAREFTTRNMLKTVTTL